MDYINAQLCSGAFYLTLYSYISLWVGFYPTAIEWAIFILCRIGNQYDTRTIVGETQNLTKKENKVTQDKRIADPG